MGTETGEERRARLLARVNEVEARRGRGSKTPSFYQQVAQIVRANPGCNSTFVCSFFPGKPKTSIETALHSASKRSLIECISRGRYARWYPK